MSQCVVAMLFIQVVLALEFCYSTGFSYGILSHFSVSASFPLSAPGNLPEAEVWDPIGSLLLQAMVLWL